MLQVKIFKNLEFQYDELSREINSWIRDQGIDAVDIRIQIAPQSQGEGSSLGSAGDSDLLGYVVYRSA
jgi:hypothetical protein